ncbi:tyrosinase family protein [Sulfitobacter sp. S190]|uniref:tyrosinase family protein n=1 Tax=Sulfitobacter sp. S190 TaxID=2867022 RepID=UPI0021A5D773|nr:tyrosinase family protein [Sulfitobacter sp. S190]UWR24521.1 tyrosinase family protein [Sulfitobacter sp. S190]
MRKHAKAHLTRRAALAAGAAGAGLLIAGGGRMGRAAAPDGSMRTGIFGMGVRKEANSLTADSDDVRMYREAVAWMKDRSKVNPLDPLGWRQHWAHHSLFCSSNSFQYQVHYGWYFLPWHRAYLANIEQRVRRILNEPSFGLPYWDWTRNPQLPAWYFGEDNPLNNPSRYQEAGDRVEPDFVELGPVLRATKWEHFGGRRRDPGEIQVEGTLEQSVHNCIHNWIGGQMASFDGAGNDPIFQSHHGQIDRLWAIWLAQGGGRANPTDADWLDERFWFAGPSGLLEDVTVRDVLETEPLGYRFDDLDYALTLTPETTPVYDGWGLDFGAIDPDGTDLAAISVVARGDGPGRVSLNYERMSLPIQPFQHRLFFVDDSPGGAATYIGTFTILPIPDLNRGLEHSVTSQVEVPPRALDQLLQNRRIRVVGVPVPLKGRDIPEAPVPFQGVSITVDA